MTDIDSPAPVRNGLLFICIGNGTRSQMAEAFARFIGPSNMRYFSAGSSLGPELHEHALKAMKEVGVDLSSYKPKTMDQIPLDTISTVISLCKPEDCPPLPAGVHHLSWPLPDPFELGGGERELLYNFRAVRDQVRELVSRLF